MNSQPEARPYGINSLLEIMQCLRDPERGCPWDLKQDFDSIAPYTLEETYELVDAIASGDYQQIKDELGDVLFQVVFYSQIGSERQLFDFDDVVAAISQKLVRRHPHVFDNPHGASISEREVKDRWEQIKSDERAEKQQTGALQDVPLALPALSRAQKLQKRAARVGFDWPERSGALAKVDEELMELREALDEGDVDHIEAELGDIFLSLVNLARHLGVDAESSLRRANQRFEHRFELMEDAARREGSSLEQEPLSVLELRWQKQRVMLDQQDLLFV